MLNRKPIGRRLSDRTGERTHPMRNKLSKKLSSMPRVGDRNVGEGIVASAVLSGAITILEDTVGVPFGGAVETVSAEYERSSGDTVYTLDVNAPTEGIAKARAFINSGTGFTAYLTEKYDIEDVTVTGKRVARDTYRVTLRL